MPILGIWASQISGHLWAPEGAYDALATVTVGSGGASSITFTGIPSGYKHLQIRAICLNTGQDDLFMAFNSDTTGANYDRHQMGGNGSSVYAYYNAGVNGGGGAIGVTSATAPAGNIIDILDYSSSVKNKTSRCLGGVDRNGSGNIQFYSQLWKSTSPVTSITFSTFTYPFSQYSQFALYGVK